MHKLLEEYKEIIADYEIEPYEIEVYKPKPIRDEGGSLQSYCFIVRCRRHADIIS